jgi:hypothetical protein
MNENVNFFNPFGTYLMTDRVPPELFYNITTLSELVRNKLDDHDFVDKTSFDRYLIGKNSYQIKIPDNFGSDTGFDSYILNLANIYINKFNCSYNIAMGNSWLNYTYSGDFNSIHTHDSLLSGVIYVKQDPLIDDEIKNVPDHFRSKTKANSPGYTNFLYDLHVNKPFNFAQHSQYSEVGTCILFPSWLCHYVNPFKCDAERITLAFNVVEKPEL